MVKKEILKPLSGIFASLSVEEIKDLQDALFIQHHELTDKDKQFPLHEIKNNLGIT